MTNLVWNIKNGELEQVMEVIKIKQIDVNSQIDGRYPLHFAADFGQNDVLSFLIEKGAKVDVVDKHSITPLLAAIWEGHTKCVETLIKKGASTKGTTPDGVPYIEATEKEDIKELLK
ncbi:myotrophin-like [Eupeodes corollae]|uniref:myotrophin-like n=1 Tax=Eupeodes corollae TaxID=290404 RepID=UPI00248F8840|nr:myotrophin-like [Eupeodes corollae]